MPNGQGKDDDCLYSFEKHCTSCCHCQAYELPCMSIFRFNNSNGVEDGYEMSVQLMNATVLFRSF